MVRRGKAGFASRRFFGYGPTYWVVSLFDRLLGVIYCESAGIKLMKYSVNDPRSKIMNPSRNQLCPCGSGLRYKRCCGKMSNDPHSFSLLEPFTEHKEITIKIRGDVMIVVPDSLDLITAYVLQEQEDWFEDEIKFVRELMQPGMKAIDIGANYGVYALSMANLVGAEGHIWAFEPTSTTMSFLKRSIELNKFVNTTLVQCALSNRIGTARLSIGQNSEGNKLCHADSSALRTENVMLTTLDSYTAAYGCEQIEFVKIDAEGEENNIITGGVAFFANESPLVMYEFKHGKRINLSLIRQFYELGYHPYRLIPGLNILAPFELTELPDPSQLNLFCCKNDRAQQLEERGILATSLVNMNLPDESNDLLWRNLTDSKPFAKKMVEQWSRRVARQPLPGWKDIKKAIECYLIAHNLSHKPDLRYTALKLSCELLKRACNEWTTIGRLCTVARVTRELGYNAKALTNVKQALDVYARQGTIGVEEEPFLPASQRFDTIDPANKIDAWIIGSLRTEAETLKSFSSYYTGMLSLQNLEILLGTGFAGSEMERRYQLIRMRYGL